MTLISATPAPTPRKCATLRGYKQISISAWAREPPNVFEFKNALFESKQLLDGLETCFLDRSDSGGGRQCFQKSAATVGIRSACRNSAGVDRGKLNGIGQHAGQLHPFVRDHLAGERDAEFCIAFCDGVGDFGALVAEHCLT